MRTTTAMSPIYLPIIKTYQNPVTPVIQVVVHKMKLSILSSLVLFLVSSNQISSVLALPASSNTISPAEIKQQASKGLHLISLSEDAKPVWKTENEVLELIQTDTGFMDVTETYHENLKIDEMLASRRKDVSALATWPAVTQQTKVNGIINLLSTSQMKSYLSTLTAFNNRYYRSTTGASASNSIYKTLTSVTSGKSYITVSQFTHSFVQKSVIVKFAGTGGITILGCHLDSVNQNNPSSGRAPGADDNGTGCVNLMDTIRSMVAYNYIPKTPLEFHFYAGEEGGLLGSQGVANSYISAGKSIKAMVNFDMTGYFAPGSKEQVALVTDRTDASLNTYLGKLISTYLQIPAGTDYCGYACSDHASWNSKGIPAAFPFEAPTEYENPYIHTSSDTTSVTGFSWAHSLQFAKLAVAVAVELTAV